MTDPMLTARQRGPHPMDRWGERGHGLTGTGGAPALPRPMTLAPGMVDDQARYPGTANDQTVVRDRGPWYHMAYYIPAGRSWISWTDAGPDRASLHVAQQTYYRQRGASNSRFPYDPASPTGGLHTDTPHAVALSLPRYRQNQQVTPGRRVQLASGQYRGQSYSATTVPLR